MRIVTALVLLLLTAPVSAGDRIATRGADYVRLMDAPCPYASVLRYIDAAKRKEFQKADSMYGGQRYFACWTNVHVPAAGGAAVLLIYEDGDNGVIPLGELRDVPTV